MDKRPPADSKLVENFAAASDGVNFRVMGILCHGQLFPLLPSDTYIHLWMGVVGGEIHCYLESKDGVASDRDGGRHYTTVLTDLATLIIARLLASTTACIWLTNSSLPTYTVTYTSWPESSEAGMSLMT